MNLVAGMLVKNESDRYLAQVIDNICLFADELVVVDDRSNDDTVLLIQTRSTIPTFVYPNYLYDFSNEVELRKMLYEKIMERKPDWYTVVDADELFHKASRQVFEELMNQNTVDFWGFRLFDMWDENHYRSDHFWKAHDYYTNLLARNVPGFSPVWNEIPQHCGRFPMNLANLRLQGTEVMKIKHYGWARADDRWQKYKRNKLYDQRPQYDELFESILDPHPSLLPWID